VSQGLRRNVVDLARKESETQAKVTPQNHLQPSNLLKQEEKQAKTKQINKLHSYKARRITATTRSSWREQKLHNLSGWEKSIPTGTSLGEQKNHPDSQRAKGKITIGRREAWGHLIPGENHTHRGSLSLSLTPTIMDAKNVDRQKKYNYLIIYNIYIYIYICCEFKRVFASARIVCNIVCASARSNPQGNGQKLVFCLINLILT
jgi:hypothetical protein